MLDRLARLCYRRRWRVLLIWIALVIGTGALSSSVGGDLQSDFNLPASESQRVLDLLSGEFGDFGDGVRVVFEAENLNDPATRKQVEAMAADLANHEGIVAVPSPYTFGPSRISPAGKVGYVAVQLEDTGPDIDRELIDALKADTEEASTNGLRAILGGQGVRFVEQNQAGFGPSEGIGILAAIFILLLTFGSVIAMGLPIMTAMFGLITGLSFVAVIANLVSVPEFAPFLSSMIGLGVGIDYALFIVTRYRQALHGGLEPEDSVAVAIDTSGRAVIFAGLTVVVSLLGLFIVGLKFIQGLAVSASVTVLMVMLASITLLPAVLGFVGHTIDKLRVPGIHRDESDHRATFWFRWSRFVQRRPLPAALGGALVLLVLAIPLFRIDLGFTDEGNDSPESSARQAYDLLAEGFGPGFNGPLILAAETEGADEFQAFKQAIAQTQLDDGVELAIPAIQNPDKTVSLSVVFPKTSPQDPETEDLIERLRAQLPDDPDIHIGGITALFADFSDYLGRRLFYFIGAVLILSFLLLMVVFRSIVIPLKAGLVNLLGIAASYGIVVAVFQWGWLSDVFGVDRTGPIEAFLPIMLFAITFGLSMDYEVFLMSRIREEYVRTKRNDIAVADGLAATARVITAAAAIMVTFFLSFMLMDDRVIKLFGLGLAAAIILDATLIRMVVVPSFMELFGDANWYMPRWLDRILPRVSIDAPPDHLTLPLFDDEPIVAEAKAKPVATAPAKAKAKAKPKAKPKPKATAKAKPKPKATAKGKPKAAKPKAAKPKPKAKAKPKR